MIAFVTVRDRVQHMIEAGQIDDQVLAEHLTAEFDGRWGHGRMPPDAFLYTRSIAHLKSSRANWSVSLPPLRKANGLS